MLLPEGRKNINERIKTVSHSRVFCLEVKEHLLQLPQTEKKKKEVNLLAYIILWNWKSQKHLDSVAVGFRGPNSVIVS